MKKRSGEEDTDPVIFDEPDSVLFCSMGKHIFPQNSDADRDPAHFKLLDPL